MFEDHHCSDRTNNPKNERSGQKRFFRYPEDAQFGVVPALLQPDTT